MADIFDVIADGTRRDILQFLLDRSGTGERGTSVSHIVAELGVSQPTVSKHLKVLREADLVSVREEGQHRYYSLSPEPLDVIDDWLVPFLVDETDASAALAAASPSLPDSAVRTADAVGRAAASAKHALESALKPFRDRPVR
ncbi:ArsR/SmtB family transcription factor [Microbacterium ulmi]|uniref:Winged helix-turn-helix transcriptional regulator n=1 Tax=Microbacterium ulmi TaxID=179095 RepID=A0A7Y2M455_9MICO|nr:metalloregulator ArsR/SmtB family transcription factor [Microbacterium ulmi]NII68811.1 DNA-binding transcriptional ArsR family regulator [Microbacterium ulmi]NNH04758.1 winged helix-turn-helix transcriptional regulator [Microbacterium ulmi]